MATASFVESNVRYRDGRKWKERWCVLKKPSPVADCLSVMLYKDSDKQVLKSNLILDEFCGIDITPFDGEKLILSIICCKKTLFLSFGTEELRQLWKQKLLLNFGKDICFKVEFSNGLPDQRLSGTSSTLNHSCICNLFLTSSRMSLTTTETSNIVLRHLYSWRYTDLKRYGSLGNNSYGIQVLFKGGEKNFVFKTHQSVEIDKALKSKVQSLIQSCGLFEQLICSISVPSQSAFSASSSNPSTPTYGISSGSSKLINNDRRFSSPHSQLSMKSPIFCNSFDNTLHRPHIGKQILSSSNVSFSGSNLPEQPYKSLVRHFSECNLHLPTHSHHRLPDGSFNSSGSCENSIENCLEPSEVNLNYINYDPASKSMTDSGSVGLLHLLKEDNKCKPQVIPPTLFTSLEKSSLEMEHVSEVPPNHEFSYSESLANVAMMNGGYCANKTTAFDPLQPLPYRDLSQYDGESDEGYLYWLPGSPGNPKKSSGYINISSAIDAKENNNCFFKSKKSIEEYLKPDLKVDNSNKDNLKVECCNESTALNMSASNYVNVSGADMMRMVSVASNPGQIGEVLFLEDIQNSDQTTYINDYIPINQLASGMRSNLVKVENNQNNQVKSITSDYVDMTGNDEPVKFMDASPVSKTLDISEKESNTSVQKDMNGVRTDKCEISCDENNVDEDLMNKILMSPPPPFFSTHRLESQDYINLSSTSVGEPVVCLNPPPRPPKLLNCIKEDASECSSPPPLPEKAKHLRANMDQDLVPLPVPPVRRRDQSIVSDLFPKPPLPRRTSHSPINLHSSPPPGLPHYNRSSILSSFSGIPSHFGGRPVSASSLSRHRKPNLTVDIKNTCEIDQGKMDTPTSITSKWRHDDLNRSMPALAIYKPRNGKEYVDRRRLAEESFAPSLPPHSAQRSPSVASSVFTFDEKSVASNPLSGWYSSGEDSPKYPPNAASSSRSSIRGKLDQKWSLTHHEMHSNGSPCSYHFDCMDSPRTFSIGTIDSIDTVINYADIDLLPGDFCIDQSKYKFAVTSSPPSTPDNRTVYAKIDGAATSAASKVGKQHAKQREDTLEKRTESATFTKFQSCDGNMEKRKLSLDTRKQSSLSIKD